MKQKEKIIVVDDHRLVLEGLAALIRDLPDFELVATATNGKDAVQLASSLHPTLLLMDIDMPVLNGLEATARIKETENPPFVIILTMHNEPSLIRKVIELGADGYLLKSADRDELSHALRKVISGKPFFSADVTKALLDVPAARPSKFQAQSDTILFSRLTEREVEILKLIAEGFSNKEIGDQLFISHRTVDTHRTNLMKKLDLHNIAGLIKFALNNGLIE